MNEVLQEIYDLYLDYSEEERIKRAKDILKEIKEHDYLAKTNIKGLDFILCLIGHIYAADKKLSKKELDTFNAVFETDYSLQELAKVINEHYKDFQFKFADEHIDNLDQPLIVDAFDKPVYGDGRLPTFYKNEYVILCLCLMSADDELSEEEIKLFETILA